MYSSGDFNEKSSFRSLIDKYESVIQDVTNELDAIQVEQNSIRGALQENSFLSSQLNKVLAEKANLEIEHKYKENHFVENLQLQLRTLIEEKEQAIKLWENAASMVDFLEAELKTYQNSSEGMVPKAQLYKLKEMYEAKVKDLQKSVKVTKAKLDEVSNTQFKELRAKEGKIVESLQCQDSTIKIIKNLEDEVLKLQQRLKETTGDKSQLEKRLKSKTSEIDALKLKVTECKSKVLESLQVVEAALNEKDAALIRENKTKEEIMNLSRSLEQVIAETDSKVKNLKIEHEEHLKKILHELKTSQEEVRIYATKCAFLEETMGKLQHGLNIVDESGANKLLTLEKNLESTFQKLLISEKQNIQLKSEMESVKNDLDQMAHYYERDVNAREAEKNVLKEEVKNLKCSLEDGKRRLAQNEEIIKNLHEKITTMEKTFEEQVEKIREEAILENEEREKLHQQSIQEFQSQLVSQTEINKKWRTETKKMTDCLEKRIHELRTHMGKVKHENKVLTEKLKDSNNKVYEYRKFMDMISQDVSKITNIALPTLGDTFNMLRTLIAQPMPLKIQSL